MNNAACDSVIYNHRSLSNVQQNDCFCSYENCENALQTFGGKSPEENTVMPQMYSSYLISDCNQQCVTLTNNKFYSCNENYLASTSSALPVYQQQSQSQNVLNNFSNQQQYQQQHFDISLQSRSQLVTAAPPLCNDQIGVAVAPCQGAQPWTYAHCYGYGISTEPCQFTELVDIEDFMSNEKRKEKSRDAARCRRSRETEIFTELAQILPMEKEDVNQLDKASIMRVAIAYLKIREMLQMFPKIQELKGALASDLPKNEQNNKLLHGSEDKSLNFWNKFESGKLMNQTLDGFLLILSNDGDVTYVTENISEYIGIAKIDILGQQIWEYSHQCDHAEIREALNIKKNGLADKVKDENLLTKGLSTDHRDLFIRFKCTLTSRGRSVNIKSASYKVIHLTGHLVVNTKGDRVLVVVGRPIPHPSNIEIPLGSTTFLTKHSLDMKFIYVDDKMLTLFGYNADDLLEKSAYNYQHGADSDSLMTSFKSVLGKGQGETCRYRFLGKYGGYCWIVTQASVVYDKQRPQSIVCVNYVISNIENDNEIYSLAQYEASKERVKEEISNSNSNSSNSSINNDTNSIDNKVEEYRQQIVDCENQKIQENLITSTKIENVLYDDDAVEVVDDAVNDNVKNEVVLVDGIIKQSPIISTKSIFGHKTVAISTTNTTTAATTKNTVKELKSPLPSSPTPPSMLVSPSVNHTKNNQSALVKCEQICANKDTIITDRKIEKNSSVCRESSLSPLRRKLQSNCSIGKKQSKIITIEEKRPKSVTASVFRVADQNLLQPSILSKQQQLPQHQLQTPPQHQHATNANSSSTGSTATTGNTILLNQNQLLQLNVAPRAQSVTASVFTPISQLPNLLTNRSSQFFIQQQQQQQQSPQLSSQQLLTSTSVAPLLKEQPKQQEQQQPEQQQPEQQQQEQQQQQQNKQNKSVPVLLRTEDMNKGYLSFAEDASDLTMLKEEPDDLSHLGSTAVDACLPLFGEMLVGLMSSYGSLLPDDINSLDSTTSPTNNSNRNANIIGSNTNNNTNNHNNSNNNNIIKNNNTTSNNPNKAHIDPFINYREESNDTNCSQHLLSPGGMSKSPEASSLPSLCSPNSLSQDDEFAFMTMNVDDDIDLSMRAPYIPMNEQDDLPLLTDDLMWSAFSEELTIQKDDPMQYDALKQQIQIQQQQQQHQQTQQSSCNGKALVDFHQQTTTNNLPTSPLPQQQHQQQQHLHHHQQYNHHSPQSNLRNSMCSSPASSMLSISPPPSNNYNSIHHHHQNHHDNDYNGQQLRHHHHNQNSTTKDLVDTKSSSLATLLCNGNNCGTMSDDNDSGIGSIGNSMSPQNHMISTFKLQNLQQHHHHQQQSQQQLHQLQHLEHQHQHQQTTKQQHQENQRDNLIQKQSKTIQDNHRNLLIDFKKEKYDKFEGVTTNFTSSIDDALDNVYSKDSSNLDCWNDLLEMNASDSLNSPTTSTMKPMSVQSIESLQTIDQQELADDHLQQQQLQQRQQQQQQQTNIIVNSSVSLLHVPLIAIQNNKNINQFMNSRNLLDNRDEDADDDDNVSRKNDEVIGANLKISNTKLLSSSSSASTSSASPSSPSAAITTTTDTTMATTSTPLPPIHMMTTKVNRNCGKVTTINKTSIMHTANLQQQQQQQQSQQLQQQQQHQQTQKRHLTTIGALDSKRLKNSSTSLPIDIQNSPQLLQQLMTAPTVAIDGTPSLPLAKPQQQRKGSFTTTNISVGLQKWSEENVGMNLQKQIHQQQQKQQQQQEKQKHQQQSSTNSVLKNLLISGCDNSKAMMITDDDYQSNSPVGPLHCQTSIDVMRDVVRSNPMIGGTGVLPSPILIPDDSDSPYSSSIISIDSDSGNDSEFDDSHEMSSKCCDTLLIVAESPLQHQHVIASNKGAQQRLLLSQSLQQSAGVATTAIAALSPPIALPPPPPICRATSISYVDSSNPLMSSFLMDLCNDDYNMHESSVYMESNEIENVLGPWTNDLV